jgi:acetyl-CoA C-acetyltransferase
MVGCGVDSITYQGGGGGGKDERLTELYPAFWMPMIDTADIVAERYKVSREYQDEYSLQSQKLMAAAQAAGKFKDEIISVKTRMKVVDKATKAESIVDYVVDATNATVPTPRWKAWPSSSRSRARASTSPPATPASCPTARPRSC